MPDGRNVVALASARALALVEQHRPALDRWYDGDANRQLIPAEDIAAVRAAIMVRLEPGEATAISEAVAVLLATMNIGPGVADVKAYGKGMVAKLLRYSTDIVHAAVSEAHDTGDWVPSTAAMIVRCERLMAQRRRPLSALAAMEREHEESRKAEEAAKRRGEERQRLASRCREVFGADLVPESEHLDGAISFLQDSGFREDDCGRHWRGAIERGEPWAVVALWRICRSRREMGMGALLELVSHTAFEFCDTAGAREALIEAGILPADRKAG
jgi:hypothetical protein